MFRMYRYIRNVWEIIGNNQRKYDILKSVELSIISTVLFKKIVQLNFAIGVYSNYIWGKLYSSMGRIKQCIILTWEQSYNPFHLLET